MFTKNPGNSGLDTYQISYRDLLKSLAFYVANQIVRCLQIAVAAMIRNKFFASKHDYKTAIIVVLTNFRGGFTFVLALMARHGLKSNKMIGDVILFHSVMQLILTHCINGPVVKYLVKKFDLNNESIFDNEILGDFLDILDSRTKEI